MKEHNKNTVETYNKTFTIIKIYSVLTKIIELIYDNDYNYNNNDEYNIKINKTEIINGLFKIIPLIISSKINHNDIVKFLSIYIHFNYTEKDAHNPRVSQIPFTKWYIKNYHNKYDIEQIFEAYNDNDKTKINKNLKSRLKNYTFIKI